jgi:hypothetical protein
MQSIVTEIAPEIYRIDVSYRVRHSIEPVLIVGS